MPFDEEYFNSEEFRELLDSYEASLDTGQQPFMDASDLVDIEAVIYCEKESHKGIIIGKGGAMLKRISTRAREDMERFLCCRVNLQCWVKVKEDWRNREGLIRNFGLEFRSDS